MTLVAVLALGVSFYRAYNIPDKGPSIPPHLSSSNAKNSLVDKDNNEATIDNKKSTHASTNQP